MFSDLLNKRDLILFPPELKICRSLWIVDVVHMGVCAGLLWEEPTELFIRQVCLTKAGHKGIGLGVNRLGSQCWCCDVS